MYMHGNTCSNHEVNLSVFSTAPDAKTANELIEIKGQCHEIVVKMSPRSSSLGLN
jgi:hypothetical protein